MTPRYLSLRSGFDRLNWSRPFALVASGVLAALSLASCGGGDSYSPTTPVTTTTDYFPIVTNSESGALMRRGRQMTTTGSLTGAEYGDTWMYLWVNKTTGTGYYTTHFISSLDKTTQIYANAVTYSDTQPYEIRDFGSKNQFVARSFENTRCQYSPQDRSPFPRRPYAAGNTWQYVWSETCLNGTVATTVNKSITGKIVALETKTLGLLGLGGVSASGIGTQRTFQTARYTATRTETSSAGTWTYADTCWHDIAQDRTVQCDTTASFVPPGGVTASIVHELSQTLAFVREVRTASPVLITDGPTTVAMYAGRWDFKLVGSGGSVTCTNMAASLTGNITGNCTRVVITYVTRQDPNNPTGTIQVPVENSASFTVSGFIDRRSVTTQNTGEAAVTRWIDAINIVADSNPNDLSITGEMLSPISAEGTWLGAMTTGGTQLTGTFAAKHL